MNIRDLYGIPKEAKIILYVGNISKNKNQEQLIEAFNLLPEIICQETYVLFLGRNLTQDYTIDNKIANSKYSSHLVLCGNIDKEYIGAYYRASNGVVLLSYSEGFGLSLIEAMHFGKPCLTFKDIDAYEDICNEKVVVGIDDRSDEKVAYGIIKLLTTDWDDSYIKEYSLKFSMDKMASNYMSVFNCIINN